MATGRKLELFLCLSLFSSVALKGPVLAQQTHQGQHWNPQLELSNNFHHQPKSFLDPFGSKPRQNTVTIAVLGLNLSGISSTVHELIGPNSTCNKSEQSEPLKSIAEYILEIPSANNSSSTGKVKILDIPGFVDGRSLEQDAQILASLKSYVQTEGPPDLYLALSPFDEKRVDGIRSLFRQFLKRIQLLNDIFLNNTAVASIDNNIVYLLTGLMSETKVNQRKPARKIGEFQRVIQTVTNFSTPISIVVGQNNAGPDYEAPVINGYYMLPNKQLYPKNVWEALINSSSSDSTSALLRSVMNSIEVALRCEAKIFSPAKDNYDDDANAFSYLLTLTNTTVADTEVNREIETAFRRDNRKMQGIVQKAALQLRLQENNITSKDDLPKSQEERVAFFQKNKQFSATIPANLLLLAFNLQLPLYRIPEGGTNVDNKRIPVKVPTAPSPHPSSTGSPGGGHASSPSHEKQDPVQTVLQLQIERNKMQIKLLEQRIADKRNRDEEQYQKDIAGLEMLKRERKRYAEERAAKMEEAYRQLMQNKESYYQSQIEALKQQSKQEEDSFGPQIDEMDRNKLDVRPTPQTVQQAIKMQQEEEAARERRRC